MLGMVLFVNINLNQRVEVLYNRRIIEGTVKYKGCINGVAGDWVGVELKENGEFQKEYKSYFY